MQPQDETFMKRAIALAGKGERFVSPNPMVGAVIVKEGRIIGEGWHRKYGGCHAEVDAIRRATEPVDGATVYVNLEPCCHHGKTPPCVDTLLDRRFRRVVIGSIDPNPRVCGGGAEALRNRGIDVTVGVLAEECRRLNARFFKFMETGLPFITLKFAQTLDGRIATATGDARWISCTESLRFAHHLRAVHDAVLVGAGTVEADDPELTVRSVKGRIPLRVVADSALRLPTQAKVFQDQQRAKTLVAATSRREPAKEAQFAKMGVEVLPVEENGQGGGVDLKDLFRQLGSRNISSILVEGGSGIITSILRERLADRILIIVAPKILGRGTASVGDLDIRRMEDSLPLKFDAVRRRGADVVIEASFA
jgi:diaminohydroxyphosphoribosylaminopyrimidine deaminase/5-amino-6-(5-phosphoribosylamino)uracil reductase